VKIHLAKLDLGQQRYIVYLLMSKRCCKSRGAPCLVTLFVNVDEAINTEYGDCAQHIIKALVWLVRWLRSGKCKLIHSTNSYLSNMLFFSLNTTFILNANLLRNQSTSTIT